MLVIGPGQYIEAPQLTTVGTATKQIVITCDDQTHGGGLGTVTFMIPQSVALDPNQGQVFLLNGTTNNNKYLYTTLNGLSARGPIGQTWCPSPSIYTGGSPVGFIFSQCTGTGDIIQNCVSYYNLHCGTKDQSQGTNGVQLLGNINFHNGTTGLDHGNYFGATNTTIKGEIDFNNTGFGIHLHSSNSLPSGQTISYCLTFGNDAALSGAGGYDLGYNPTAASSCSISHCTSGDLLGRGFFHEGNGSGTAGQWVESNNIGWGTKATGGVGGLDFDNITAGPTVDHCDFDFASSSVWPNSLVTNCLGMPSQVGLDPLFLSPSTGNYTLGTGSPCIGAGTGGTNMGAY
jgi:hypothetical protein